MPPSRLPPLSEVLLLCPQPSPAQAVAHSSHRVLVEKGAGNSVVPSELRRQDSTFSLLPPDVGISLKRVSLAACVGPSWSSVVKVVEESFQHTTSAWES